MKDQPPKKCTQEGYIVVNRLVRDKEPENIKKEGGDCVVQELPLGVFRQEIRKKLLEEVQELLEAETRDDILYEATDVYFALLGYMKAYRVFNQFEQSIKSNFLEKGGFEKQLFLVCYSDPEQKTS